MRRRTIRKLLFYLVVGGAFSVILYYVYLRHKSELPSQHRNDEISPNKETSLDIIDKVPEFTEVLFPNKPLVLWCTDHHITPINDLRHLLQPLGVKIIDKNFDWRCGMTSSCGGRKNLRVINESNTNNMEPEVIQKFYESYWNDSELASVDAFICHHPAAMCELYMPFNKSIIVMATTRSDILRWGGPKTKERLSRWRDNLIQIATNSRNFVGANNRYDAEYIKYFTGIDTKVVPSFCGYPGRSYNQSKSVYLLGVIHNRDGFQDIFLREFSDECLRVKCAVSVVPLRQIYPASNRYTYADLAAHPGHVIVPYQASVMTYFETYRMNIPMFFPTKELLTTWQHRYQLMNERTMDGVFGGKPKGSVIEPHPTQKDVPDPNNEHDKDAIEYWMQFADFYYWPNLTYYNSTAHLIIILEAMRPTDLQRISDAMKVYNAQSKVEILTKWKEILLNVARHSANRPN